MTCSVSRRRASGAAQTCPGGLACCGSVAQLHQSCHLQLGLPLPPPTSVDNGLLSISVNDIGTALCARLLCRAIVPQNAFVVFFFIIFFFFGVRVCRATLCRQFSEVLEMNRQTPQQKKKKKKERALFALNPPPHTSDVEKKRCFCHCRAASQDIWMAHCEGEKRGDLRSKHLPNQSLILGLYTPPGRTQCAPFLAAAAWDGQ